MKGGGHNWHPSRTSQRSKNATKRAFDELSKKKKKPPFKPLDTKKNDWSTKK